MLSLLEIDRIEDFLNAHFGGGVRELAPIGAGDWSQAFSFQHDDTALVARFGEHGEDYVKDRIAFRFAHRDLPIPRAREIGQALGRHFCISDRAYGEMWESLDAEGMRRIVPAVFRAFDALLHFNVLAADDRINAVVDWGNSLYGDFLYELAAFSFYAPWYPAMETIDWALEARLHFEQIGLNIPNFEARLRCYQAHIGLGGMAYNGFTRSWKELADTANRTLALIRG